MRTTVGGGSGEVPKTLAVENHLEAEILKLRRRWELASVLNFLDVFGPIIGKDLKLSADEIEIGLIKPDVSLAQLHIVLLKGIPPVSKALDSDTWVTALCKKMTMWWPWVAEGRIPLMPSRGEEICKYKELDPSDRLLLLKALCEIRADQHDAVSYINDALKEGTQISYFRKDALGGDGNGTSYWYDANAKGHRLYREIISSDSNAKAKTKRCSSLPTLKFQWETLASNFKEFSKLVEEYSSSKIAAEVAIGKKIQGDAIPILEKLHKKKERALKRKQRQEKLSSDLHNSYRIGITRSCRTRRHISYTFDDYDRAIEEAIEVTKKGKVSSNASLDRIGAPEDESSIRDDSTDSDSKKDVLLEVDSDDTDYEIENHREDDDDIDSELGNSEADTSHAVFPPKGVRYSQRLAGVSSHTILESRGLTKHRLRQRPIRNSALECIALDSDDEAHERKDDLSHS